MTHRSSLKGRLLHLAAVFGIAASVVAIVAMTVLYSGPATAETPAERCKRETAAYNNAWKHTWAQANPGKSPSDAPKPPVPYKCGGGDGGPPPTLPPTSTTPEVAPETTSPTTTAPKDKGTGPSLNGPTDRRDIEHPGAGQRTVENGQRRTSGRATTPSPLPSRRPATVPSESSKPGAGNRPPLGADPYRRKSTADGKAPFDPMGALSTYKYQAFGSTPPPSDPINDGCSYCTKDSVGRVQNGPANSPDGWINNWGCPDGTHATGVACSL